MRIAVVGLGAIGGLLAIRLARAGHEVSALARGAVLAAVRERGLRLRSAPGDVTAALRASDDARDLGAQDLVVVALKGPALAGACPAIQSLLGEHTVVMPAMNGVPWWFLRAATTALDAAVAQPPLASIDPGDRIGAALPLPRVLGCVVHLTCSSPEPGVIQHGFGERLIIGEPAGGASERVATVCAALAQAGFTAEASSDIRSDLWYKLWGNMTMNPVSALTGALTDRILDDPLVRDFILLTMAEAAQIGARIGCPINQSGEARMAVTRAEAAQIGARIGCPINQSGEARMAVTRELGGFRTSMLQDAAAGRPLELDALVGAVHEIGARVGVAMPHIGALLGLTRLMAQERGLYPR